jgi:hypothetical protein
MLISKIILKNKKYIILIYFCAKNTLKISTITLSNTYIMNQAYYFIFLCGVEIHHVIPQVLKIS